MKWAIEHSKDNKMSPKNHRKKGTEAHKWLALQNRELPTNVCNEKYSFRKRPEEKPKEQ